MQNKKKVLLLSSLLGAGVLTAFALTAKSFLDSNVIGANANAIHSSEHTNFHENAYIAPTIEHEGAKPYWMCLDCCPSIGPSASRYDYLDKTKQITDFSIPKLTEAASSDITEGDMIGNVDTVNFKYVDQCVNGVDGQGGESTPVYVKDGGRTAIFFSRSGKTGQAYEATTNDYCSEFGFKTGDFAHVSSISFSYRYLDYGKGVWAGESSDANPVGSHLAIQFKDEGKYYGKGIELTGDDAWHTLSVDYSSYASAGNKEATTALSDVLFKFVDLRGHIYISGLTFELAPISVTLKNTNEAGEDVVEKILPGELPKMVPSLNNRVFKGWYTEDGNPVSSVTGSTKTLVAHFYAVDSVINDYSTIDLKDTVSTVGSVKVVGNDGGPDVNLVSKAIKGASNENWLRGKIKGEGYTIGETASSYIEFAAKSIDAAFSGKQNAMRLTLPAVDFSKCDSVTLSIAASDYGGIYLKTIASQYSQDGASLAFASSPMGVAPSYVTQGTITVKNDGTIVFYNDEDQKVRQTFKLSEKVRTGQEGLAFDAGIADANCAARLFLTDFNIVLKACDILPTMQDAYSKMDLNDTDKKAASVLYSILTPYEKSLFSEASVSASWMSLNNDTYKMDAIHRPISKDGEFLLRDYYGMPVSAKIENGVTFSFALPKIDMSSYSSLSFMIVGSSNNSAFKMGDTSLFKMTWKTKVTFRVDVAASKMFLTQSEDMKATDLVSEISLPENILSGEEAFVFTIDAYNGLERDIGVSDITAVLNA